RGGEVTTILPPGRKSGGLPGTPPAGWRRWPAGRSRLGACICPHPLVESLKSQRESPTDWGVRRQIDRLEGPRTIMATSDFKNVRQNKRNPAARDLTRP